MIKQQYVRMRCLNGIAPKEAEVVTMEKAIDERANEKGYGKAIAERQYWENAPLSDDCYFWIFKDYDSET